MIESSDQPSGKHVLSMLDGSVFSQGVKISHRQWLDMGSKEWSETSDKDKAAAYQAAKVTGWEEKAIRGLMLGVYGHLKESTLDMTFKLLEELVKLNPIEVEEVKSSKIETVIRPYTKQGEDEIKVDIC